jgi:hypothetical protein
MIIPNTCEKSERESDDEREKIIKSRERRSLSQIFNYRRDAIVIMWNIVVVVRAKLQLFYGVWIRGPSREREMRWWVARSKQWSSLDVIIRKLKCLRCALAFCRPISNLWPARLMWKISSLSLSHSFTLFLPVLLLLRVDDEDFIAF